MARLLQERRARRAESSKAEPPRMRLADFVREAWPIVEPKALVWERHMDEVCRHLEAVTAFVLGDVCPAFLELLEDPEDAFRHLIINVPPGTSKSSIVSVLWPAWVWTYHPPAKFLSGSYSERVSRRDALRSRLLVESDWYVERWGRLKPDSDTIPWTAGLYVNTKGGSRFSTSVGGQITGFHGDFLIVDDPIKPADADAVSGVVLAECLTWWNVTMSTRQTNPEKTARVIIMQRLHEGDLAGEMAKTGLYEHLRLPMEYEEADPCRTKIGGDWRTEEGELLAPKRYPLEAVRELKKILGPMGAASQLQQSPSPAGGAIFKREWMGKRWDTLPTGLTLIQSWDCRFKEESDSGDWVVGQIWGMKGGEFFLIAQVRGRWSFTETVQAIKDLSRLYPAARLKLIENKANGPAVVSQLKKQIPGLILVEPEGGKIARANAVTGLWEAGNVHLPNAPWVLEFVEELAKFPKAKNDDQVDAATQALLRLSLRSPGRYVDAMKRAANG
jgi:predicted phage terminase large subunit-like protein